MIIIQLSHGAKLHGIDCGSHSLCVLGKMGKILPTKRVKKAKRVQTRLKRHGDGSLRSAFMVAVKETSGRKDIKNPGDDN